MARYRAIAADLAAKIREGHYAPGEALPAQRELSAAYGVTLMTLRQALRELDGAGLIVQRPGKGTFVAPPHLAYQLGSLRSLADDLREQGHEVRTTVIGLAQRRVPARIAARLRTRETETGLRLERVRAFAGRRAIHQVSWVREPPAARLRDVDFTTTSLYAALADMGVAVARASETIRPEVLGPDVARHLDEDAGAPVLVSDRITYGPDGTALVADRATILGSMMQITADRAATGLSLHWGATPALLPRAPLLRNSSSRSSCCCHDGGMTDLDHVLLPGRRLDVRVSGPAAGLPVIFHHGTPGARTPFRAIERAVHARGLRLVTASRPGYGDSTPQPGRHVVDVVADTQAVLAAIGADRCLVAGWSGGGPHALACGARLSAAAGVLVIAGVAPYGADGLDWMAGMGEENIEEFSVALQGEDALRPYLLRVREHLKETDAEGIIASLGTILPDVDRALLTGELGADMAASFAEALRTGVEGWLEDDLAFARPWGFDLAEITAPTMVWQGSADLMVPFAHGQWLASRVAGVTAHLEDGEGHLSIAIGALDRMLDELLSMTGAG